MVRDGAGPGEPGNAEGIVVASDGLRWVRDAESARLTVFDADGKIRDSWTMQYCWSRST